jgi:hypothetical protein
MAEGELEFKLCFEGALQTAEKLVGEKGISLGPLALKIRMPLFPTSFSAACKAPPLQSQMWANPDKV